MRSKLDASVLRNSVTAATPLHDNPLRTATLTSPVDVLSSRDADDTSTSSGRRRRGIDELAHLQIRSVIGRQLATLCFGLYCEGRVVY